jgi:hypothetical protein
MAMPRFSLRTLMVVMLLGGPVCAWGWRMWRQWREPLITEVLTSFDRRD